MLEELGDLFRTGEALTELARTKAAAGAPDSEVRAAWLRAAAAYERAGAPEEADDARARADGSTAARA
jgi:hypothetical protein